jgi:hypothetical protein
LDDLPFQRQPDFATIVAKEYNPHNMETKFTQKKKLLKPKTALRIKISARKVIQLNHKN